MIAFRRFALAVVLSWMFPFAAQAQQAPATATPQELPPNVDPCGGPQELLSKYGTTPCVVVGGQAMLSAGYVTGKVNGNISLNNGAFGPLVTVPTSLLVRSYPTASLTVGLDYLTDMQIIPPTYARIDGARVPLLVSGSTDWSVGFKRRVAVDIKDGMITSVAVAAEFPTGSPSLRAAGPSYNFDLIGSKTLAKNWILLYDMRLSNTALGGGSRQTTLSPTIVGAWVSPGNMLAGAGAVILANGATAPLLTVEQLVSRQLGIAVLYAGMGAAGFTSSTQTNLPIVNAINANGSVNVFSVTLFGLIGKSGP